MVINANNLVVSEDASRQDASNSTDESGKAPVVLDPEKIFSKDIGSMDLNEKMIHIIQQNTCNFLMNKKTDSKTTDNASAILAQEETIQVLKMNQQCIAQQVLEVKNQFVDTHTYINNKIDEVLKDTQESLREDRNVLLWQLEKKALNEFKKDSQSEVETLQKYAFKIVKEKLNYIEPIDIRAASVPSRPGDKPEHFRMIIKFVSPGDANKFRVRLNAEGTITLRKGMSLMTRDLCSKYKDLARRKNEAEPEGSNFEYRTKFQFSIVKHTKGDPDDIHGILHSLNPSEPYSKLKLRKGMDLIPYPNEEDQMEVPEDNRSVTEVPNGQDLGNVDTAFVPPGTTPADLGEFLATPVGRKRDRDNEADEEAQVDSAMKDPKKFRDNNGDSRPRGRQPYREIPRHGGQPRGNFGHGHGNGGQPRGDFNRGRGHGGLRGGPRGAGSNFGDPFSYRNGSGYRKNNGFFQQRRDGGHFRNGYFRRRNQRYDSSYDNRFEYGYDGYDPYSDYGSSNHIPIGQRSGKPRGRPRGSSNRGRGGSRIDPNSNEGNAESNTSSSSKSSDTVLSQDQQQFAQQVPDSFNSFDSKYIAKMLSAHQKPKLAMKITQQREELDKKGLELQAMEKRNQDLLKRLEELEATGGTGLGSRSTGSSSTSSAMPSSSSSVA